MNQRQLFKKTAKTFISPLPRVTFNGKIVVVQSTDEAERAVKALKTYPVLGIDTETRPSFHRGEQHKVALLQLASEDICFLFRLNHMGLPACVEDLLCDENTLKVGLSLKDDFLMLRRRREFTPRGFIDLQNLAASMGIEDMSLQKLYANVFHQRISKSAQLSNWEADVLTETQKIYAATDAYTCVKLYKEMMWLKENGDYVLVSEPARLA